MCSKASQLASSISVDLRFIDLARLVEMLQRDKEGRFAPGGDVTSGCFSGTVISVLNKVKGGSGAGLRPAPATAPEPGSVQPFSFLDDHALVPFFPAQDLERDLLHFRQLRKLHDDFAVEFHLAVLEIVKRLPKTEETSQCHRQ